MWSHPTYKLTLYIMYLTARWQYYCPINPGTLAGSAVLTTDCMGRWRTGGNKGLWYLSLHNNRTIIYHNIHSYNCVKIPIKIMDPDHDLDHGQNLIVQCCWSQIAKKLIKFRRLFWVVHSILDQWCKQDQILKTKTKTKVTRPRPRPRPPEVNKGTLQI